MKNNRQKQILAIITDHDVETQEELIARLKASGFKATQATVSRDIKELKLIKIATDNGIPMLIINGENPYKLYEILDGKHIGTYFATKNKA